jgi:hypothetical protein
MDVAHMVSVTEKFVILFCLARKMFGNLSSRDIENSCCEIKITESVKGYDFTEPVSPSIQPHNGHTISCLVFYFH